MRLAFDSLRVHPLRTLLSTLGIVMGAASLAAVLALGDGAERFARQRIEREGLSVVVLRPRTEDVVDGLRVPARDYPLFGPDDARAVTAIAGPGVTTRLVMEGTGLVEVPGQRARAAWISAEVYAGGPPQWALSTGRALRRLVPEGAQDGTREVLVSDRLARELQAAGAGHGPGATIVMNGERWTVTGVLAPYPGEREFRVVVPFASGERAMVASPMPRARTLALLAARVEDMPAVKASLERMVASRADWRDRVRLEAYGPERLKQVTQGILIFKMLMGAFTAISLLVGGIGITNVLLASIVERTREIGIRKAVGARRRDLVLQFLAESIAIAGAGSGAGVVLGVGGAMLVTAIIRAKTDVPIFAAFSWQTLAVSAAAAAVVGLAAGVYPAVRASRLTPMDAIQRE